MRSIVFKRFLQADLAFTLLVLMVLGHHPAIQIALRVDHHFGNLAV